MFNLLKRSRRVIEASRSKERNSATRAFDANVKTFWQSKGESEGQLLAIDLGKEYALSGFMYTPQTSYHGGMMAKGIFEISSDGKNWEKVTTFEFGNLINDPSKRTQHFSQKKNARYVRVVALEIAGKEKGLAIAEIDFF